MTDENKLIRDRARGMEAERLMAEPLLVEAFAAVDAAILKTWKESQAGDEAIRQNCWLSAGLLKKLQGYIASVASGGKMAIAELTRLENERKRKVRV